MTLVFEKNANFICRHNIDPWDHVIILKMFYCGRKIFGDCGSDTAIEAEEIFFRGCMKIANFVF
jgi:hypothetical protein